MKHVLVLLALVFMSAPAFSATSPAPPAAVYDVAPFNKPAKQLGAATCKKPFSCYADGQQVTQVAGECVQKVFVIPSRMMSRLEVVGAYTGCVIPDNYTQDAERNTATWAVCCFDPAKADAENMCKLTCYRYVASLQ